MTDRTVILVPRRANPERDKLWAYARGRWERYHPQLEVVEGFHTDGPFNRSAAVNAAARAAGRWDYGIVIDADVFIAQSQVIEAIDTAKATGRVTWAHRRWRGLHKDWTERLIADRHDVRQDLGPEVDREDMDVLVERTNPISWSCCIVFPRAVFDDLGGFDERFRGWGFEDMAVQSVVAGLYGHERVEGDIYHLWHSRTPAGGGRAAKAAGGYTAEAITNARLGRRYMVALRRDHRLHDRPGLPSSEEERLRDIANLERDDRDLAAHVKRLGLPDWSGWWPTLEELRDGARRYNGARAGGSVTLVVTSGGTAETWPVRREYLRASLASLTARVSGPVVQRVVYSDWPAAVAADLEALAGEFGFYVAGGGHEGHTSMRKRLWRYLAKRATGEYVFATEDDFDYVRDVDLGDLVATLAAEPDLVQIALLRDACYPDEVETGGILGWPEPAFTRRARWLEHRQFWTNNPSLFRQSLTAVPWPETGEDPATGRGPGSEVIFGRKVLADPKRRAAFWGGGENWVTHQGAVRAGSGY